MHVGVSDCFVYIKYMQGLQLQYSCNIIFIEETVHLNHLCMVEVNILKLLTVLTVNCVPSCTGIRFCSDLIHIIIHTKQPSCIKEYILQIPG